MDKLLLVGSTIVNILIRSKLNGDICDNYTDAISVLKELGLKTLEAREVNRCFEKIGDNIATSCEKVLEHSSVKQERKEIIIQYLLNAYSNLNLSYKSIFDFINNEDKLLKELLKVSKGYEKEFDIKEGELFQRLLEHTVHLIVNASVNLPEFTSQGIKHLVGEMNKLTKKIDNVIEQLELVNELVEEKSSKIRNFERNYRNKVLNRYSYIQLFGAGTLEREYKRYQLDIAYVRLEISNKNTEKVIELDELLTKNKNVWIIGEAGSGKTTFLQWLAVCSAGKIHEIAGLEDTVPVLIELRKLNSSQIGLKECILNVMKDSSYSIPEGWIEELVEKGRFVFLIDGFDEVDEGVKEQVLDWLKEVDKNNKCKKVFSSRPQVKERPKLKELLEVRMLPMDRRRIGEFIQYWHVAVLVDQLKIDLEGAKGISNKLKQKIFEIESLYKLASNPLLCAMICALHYRNEMNLPMSKRELYEECCKMLLERRDLEREIKIDNNVKLDYERKKIIMAQLAYWMMRNNHVEVEITGALNCVKRSISGMNINNSDEKLIFKYLLERSGLLRQLETSKVGFIHRSFQEYLAAYEISREEDWGYLGDKIGDETWQETIGMAIGNANKKVTNELLEYTLEKGKEREKEKKYLFLALTFLANAVEVRETLRNSIEMKAKALIPPSIADSYSLSQAGNLVVSYLVFKKEYSLENRIGCLHTLEIIATERALEASVSYLNEVTTKEEINILGKIFEIFDDKILIQYEIHLKVAYYIERVCGNKVIISGNFLRVINLLNKEEGLTVFDNVVELTIIDYSKGRLRFPQNVFHNVKKMQIEGNFYSVPILWNFDGLESLKIICKNSVFSIYSFNEYDSVYEIKEFDMIWKTYEFINGNDLKFLANAEQIRLVNLENCTELYFENFNKLKHLERLEIGSENIVDYDYGELPPNIKELVLYASEDDREYGVDKIIYEIENVLNLNTKVIIESYEELLSLIDME